MLFVLSRILSRSSCILIIVSMSNLAIPLPLNPWKRSTSELERGFSASPRILEIQLPLRIASKEDLVAWSKYVMSLVTSKINYTSTTLKNVPSIGAQFERRSSVVNNPGFKSKETTKKAFPSEKRINYPARRLKEPFAPSPNNMVVAYPLPIGEMKFAASKPQDPLGLYNGAPTDRPVPLKRYTNFNVGNHLHRPSEMDAFGSPDMLRQMPANSYLPLPMKMNDVAPYQNTVDQNISDFEEPAKLQSRKHPVNLRVKAFNDELGQLLSIAANDRLMGKNLSRVGEPLLTFPFQAVITITRQQQQQPVATSTKSKGSFASRFGEPRDEFPPRFPKNESGQVNVILDDFFVDADKKRTKDEEKKNEEEEGEEEEEEEEEEEQEARGQKKKNEKKKKSEKQQKSKKRQSSVLADLLRMLGVLKKLPKNTTEISVTAPVLSILKGTNTQKIQVAFEDTLPNQERPNVTFQSQELNGDDDDDEEEEGGSIQAIIDLLPLAAPILEELSDPESNVNLVEVIQGAIPLLEGLSDPNEEGGIDIPAVLGPLSQRLFAGPDGNGSDSGAILGPLVQLIAPLIGPLAGPLSGPLSRTSSGPEGVGGSASIIGSLSGPLSEPGPYGKSVLSNLIAGITAMLSKELLPLAGESDVKSLVSSIVSGVLAGTSAGSSGGSKGHKGYGTYGPYGYNGNNGNNDAYYAQTSYGTYSKPASPNISDMINGFIKEILAAFLKLSSTSSTSSANLSAKASSSSVGLSTGSSESNEPPSPMYGTPTRAPYTPPTKAPYAPPMRPVYNPPSTNSYTTFTRRQVKQQIKKF